MVDVPAAVGWPYGRRSGEVDSPGPPAQPATKRKPALPLTSLLSPPPAGSAFRTCPSGLRDPHSPHDAVDVGYLTATSTPRNGPDPTNTPPWFASRSVALVGGTGIRTSDSSV